MNNKKYISVGFFIALIAIGGGIAYYFDPVPINNALGIDSAQIDDISSGDIPVMDDTSSSVTTSAPLPQEKPAQKEKSVTKSAAMPVQTRPSQQATPIATASQDENSPAGEAVDDGDDTSVSATAVAPPVPCSFPISAPSTTRKIIFNEIAWMGSASTSNAEWIEIKNISPESVDLSGWAIENASGKIKILFSDGDALASGGLMLLSRGGSAAKIYSGDLVNGGDVLALMDPQCDTSDYLDASNGWPGGNNTTKATLERDANGVGWHTSAAPGGTPGAENSAGPAAAEYKLTVAFGGSNAGATITSDPAGLVCAASCTGSYASGTLVTLTPVAGTSTAFDGWSGFCYGETVCSFAIAANTSLTAGFHSTLPVAQNLDPASASDNASAVPADVATSSASSSVPSDDPAPAGHILIAAIQIAGASSSNDLVKLYNPTAAAVDMSGWKLHKKSESGADYSLKEFPLGSVVAAGQSFTWANSTGGFSATVGANVSSTETLSADNSVALLDAAGNVVDAVAWGTGVGQYGEGSPYPTDPVANQTLARRSSGGAMTDTENNINDFIIQ